MEYPVYRPRRMRKNPNFRRLIRETRLTVDDLIYPLFVVPGEGVKEPVPSMPGVFRLSVDNLVKEVEEVASLRIPAIILFGIPESKDEVGSGAYAEDGIIQRAVRAIKEKGIDIVVITDVCMCEYTSHGHCGIIKDGDVDNDSTLELLA
ncbi:MAG: porphobilinogen synthase, partial [Deltaproteobacteria bacterium]